LVGRQEGHPDCKKWRDGGGGHCLVRMEWRPAGWPVRLPLLIFPFTIKSRSSLLTPADPGCPGKRAVKRMCVCVCVCWEADPAILFDCLPKCGKIRKTVNDFWLTIFQSKEILYFFSKYVWEKFAENFDHLPEDGLHPPLVLLYYNYKDSCTTYFVSQ